MILPRLSPEQVGYQLLLPEAVAIVLCPPSERRKKKTRSHGVFRLSHPEPPGLAEVQRCTRRGFHPEHQRNGQNAGNGVYEEGAHVRWDEAAPLQVVDLRRGR